MELIKELYALSWVIKLNIEMVFLIALKYLGMDRYKWFIRLSIKVTKEIIRYCHWLVGLPLGIDTLARVIWIKTEYESLLDHLVIEAE